ncbi:MAG: hypothetical protein ACOH2H_00340 [Cypionkella sp.]
MYDIEVTEPRAIFVVLLHEVLVALDIEMIITDILPKAEVLVARRLEDAVLQGCGGRIAAAFVEADITTFAESALGRRVTSDGGKTVLVGREPKPGVPLTGCAVLAYPFTREDVTALLKDVARL